jgi:hypothetical protein
MITGDPSLDEYATVRELLLEGLQRGDAAAAIWLTPEQFDQLMVAGCSPQATEDQRNFAAMVFESENEFKKRLIKQILVGRNSYGPIELLRMRFKATWGKEAKPAPDAIPNNIIDWDAALKELLDQEDSPLHRLLDKHGWMRKKKR